MRERHEAHVVVVEGVGGDAVGERRIARAGPFGRARMWQGARFSDLTIVRTIIAGGRFERSRQRDADRVAHGVCGAVACPVARRGVHDELCDGRRQVRGDDARVGCHGHAPAG